MSKPLYLKPCRPDLAPAPVQIAYTVKLPTGACFTMAKPTVQIELDFFRVADYHMEDLAWDVSVDGDGKKI